MPRPQAFIDLKSYARTFTRSAVRTLASVMRNPETPPAARVAAATVLLDRGWGRAVQHVEQTGEVKQLIEVKLSVVSPALASEPMLELEANEIKHLDKLGD